MPAVRNAAQGTLIVADGFIAASRSSRHGQAAIHLAEV